MKRILLSIVLFMWFTDVGNSQTTEFVYQGNLRTGTPPNAVAANGDHDFEFALFDALSGGTQLGATLTRSSVPVDKGTFSVSLDFGEQFPGASRYLNISVRPAGAGTFTALTPRQPISNAPYSVRSLKATTADSVPVAGIPAGSANYIQNTNSLQASSRFNISGNGAIGGMLGIGQQSPAFPLTFANTLGDKISLFGNSGAVYGFGIQNGLLQVHTDIGSSDIAFGYGSSGSLTETMRIKGNGNVGIGTASPVSKLQVSGVGGIRAHVNSDSNAGLGLSLNNQPKWSLATVNPGQFQIFNDAIGANALWIDGTTNNVGIGVANPGYALDLGQRMRLRHGGFTAGLWFNNSSNNEAAFVGMEDDTHIGIYGNGGAFWKFGMNTVTGALRVDGSEGQAGQVLTSRGSGAAAQWKSPTSQYQLTNMNINSGTTAPGSTPTTIPGLAQTISVSGNAKLLVQWGVRVEANDCCFGSTAWIDITLNGGVVNTVQHSVANNSRAFISGSWMMAVGPGSHTVEIKAWSGSGAPLLVFGGVGGIRSNLIVQVIPE